MKLIPGLIILSLGLNALLATGVAQRLKPSQATIAQAGANNTSGTIAPATSAATASTPVPSATTNAPPFHWRMLETEDYHQYVANLRAIKCPESTIQDIVLADLARVISKQFRELNHQHKLNWDGSMLDYWKSDDEAAKEKKIRDDEMRAIRTERREALIALLGVDAESERRLRLGLPDDDGSRYPFMSAAKINQIRDIWAEYTAMEKKTRENFLGYSGAELQAEYHRIALERDAAAAKVLTPTEKEEWMLRVSHPANLMRSSLSAFEPNEQEFRALYRIEYDQYLKIGPYAYMGINDPEDTLTQARKLETQQTKDALIRTVLGEQRFNEYVMTQSSDFKQLYQITQSAGLGKETALQAYQMKQASDNEVAKLVANQSLSPEDRQKAIVQVQQATGQAMQQVLGDSNFRRYQAAKQGVMTAPAVIQRK